MTEGPFSESVIKWSSLRSAITLEKVQYRYEPCSQRLNPIKLFLPLWHRCVVCSTESFIDSVLGFTVPLTLAGPTADVGDLGGEGTDSYTRQRELGYGEFT